MSLGIKHRHYRSVFSGTAAQTRSFTLASPRATLGRGLAPALGLQAPLSLLLRDSHFFGSSYSRRAFSLVTIV